MGALTNSLPQQRKRHAENLFGLLTVTRVLQTFNPQFANADMRSRLSDGHPEDPLIIYVGRLGAEKRLRDLRGILER